MIALLLAYGEYMQSSYQRLALSPSARPLAVALLQQHDTAVRLVNADHSLTGILAPAAKAWRINSAARFTSCTAGGTVATWTIPAAALPSEQIAAAMQAINRNALGAGMSQGGLMQQPSGTMSLPPACNIPDGVAVAVTRSF